MTGNMENKLPVYSSLFQKPTIAIQNSSSENDLTKLVEKIEASGRSFEIEDNSQDTKDDYIERLMEIPEENFNDLYERETLED
tara:strand:- start:281 stop:529 length:249 start_codon:yes stop_codon:yes gene_type:complete